MPSPDLPPGFDFTDPDIYAKRLPIEELAHMRKVAPIWWNEQPKGVGGFDDGGFWVVTKHKDVKEVSVRSEVFSSVEKTALPRYKDGTVDEQIDRGKFVLLFPDREVPLEREGDFVLFGPGVAHSFRSVEESLVLTVRWPSKPQKGAS